MFIKAIPLLLAVAISAVAGEYAVLASGARLHIDHHEAEGTVVRLYTGTGSTELPAAMVTAFEREEYAPPKPAAAAPAPATGLDLRRLVEQAARKYGLPPTFLHSVVKAESAYRADAVSPKGAVGLMQLMPGTARQLGADPANPVENVDAGARYLRELLDKYDRGAWRALAAYNAGPGAVDKHNGVPPYRETREYIRRVMQEYQKLAE